MYHFAQSVNKDNETSPALWSGGIPNMKSKLTDFQQSVGIGSGISVSLLEGAGFTRCNSSHYRLKNNWLLTYIGVATKIHLTLVRMSFHGPDDHLMAHHGASRESSV